MSNQFVQLATDYLIDVGYLEASNFPLHQPGQLIPIQVIGITYKDIPAPGRYRHKHEAQGVVMTPLGQSQAAADAIAFLHLPQRDLRVPFDFRSDTGKGVPQDPANRAVTLNQFIHIYGDGNSIPVSANIQSGTRESALVVGGGAQVAINAINHALRVTESGVDALPLAYRGEVVSLLRQISEARDRDINSSGPLMRALGQVLDGASAALGAGAGQLLAATLAALWHAASALVR